MNLRSPSVLIAVVALLVLVGGGAAFATTQGGGSGSSAPKSDSAMPGFEGIATGERADMFRGMGRAPRFAEAASDYLGLSVSQIFERLANGQSLAQMAKAQGKSVEGLKNAIVDGAEADLAKKVDEGWLTDQQRDSILKLVRSSIDEIVNHEGLPGPDSKPGRGFGPGGMPGLPGPRLGMLPGVDEAAKYLGLSVDELTTRLGNGRSLAQIAKAQGKSVEGLKAAIVDGVQSDLDKAVDKGMPAQLKNKILETVRSSVDDIVNGRLPSFGGPGMFGGHRFGPPGGFAPPGGFGPPGGMPDDSQGSNASFA